MIFKWYENFFLVSVNEFIILSKFGPNFKIRPSHYSEIKTQAMIRIMFRDVSGFWNSGSTHNDKINTQSMCKILSMGVSEFWNSDLPICLTHTSKHTCNPVLGDS